VDAAHNTSSAGLAMDLNMIAGSLVPLSKTVKRGSLVRSGARHQVAFSLWGFLMHPVWSVDVVDVAVEF
jgi:hypothetical protein